MVTPAGPEEREIVEVVLLRVILEIQLHPLGRECMALQAQLEALEIREQGRQMEIQVLLEALEIREHREIQVLQDQALTILQKYYIDMLIQSQLDRVLHRDRLI
jgi:hypothetical protein